MVYVCFFLAVEGMMATADDAARPTVRWRNGVPERLPALSGAVLTLYTIVWCLVLPLALVAPIAGTVLSIHARAAPLWRPLGFEVEYAQIGWRVTTVWGREARAAGIAPGMELVAVNGHRLGPRRPDPSWFHVADGAREQLAIRSGHGEEQRWLVRRPDVARQIYPGSGFSELGAKWVSAVAGLLPMLCFVPAAALLFRHRRDAVAAAISLAFLLIGASAFVAGNSWSEFGLAALASPFGDFGWFLLIVGLATFPSGRFAPRWTWTVVLAAILWFVLDFVGALPDAAYNDSLISLLVLCSLAQAQRYRGVSSSERQQLRWALFGFALGAGLLGIATFLLGAWDTLAAADARWLVWRYTFIYPVVDVAAGLFALGLLVSLLRYRLYSVDAVISRSVAYATLTVILLAIFAGSEKLLELLGEEYFGEQFGALAGVLGATVAAVTLVPLHHRVRHWAEHHFRKPLIALRQGLPPLLSDLRETAGLEKIAAAVLDAVTHGVRASRAALLVDDKLQDARGVRLEDVETWRPNWVPAVRNGLDCAREDSLFPLRVPLEAEGHGRVGWLLLGPRPDATFYGGDERRTLAAVADPIARGIQIVRLREAREKAQDARFAKLEDLATQALELAQAAKGQSSGPAE